MNREYPQFPLVGVGGVVVQEKRVLLVKRAKPPLKDRWSLPGGMLELGETVRDACAREILEETGLRVSVEQLLGVFDRVVRDGNAQIQYHYVLIDFSCSVLSGELRAGGDASDTRWFAREELSGLKLATDTQKLIENALNANHRS